MIQNIHDYSNQIETRNDVTGRGRSAKMTLKAADDTLCQELSLSLSTRARHNVKFPPETPVAAGLGRDRIEPSLEMTQRLFGHCEM